MSCTCLARPIRSVQLTRNTLRSFSTSSIRSAPAAASPPKSTTPVSSCPAGTKFTGLGFKKDGSDPVAMEDSEYPAWLWQILEPKKSQGVEAELRKMKKEGRSAIKASNTLKG